MERRHAQVVNVNEVEGRTTEVGARFGYTWRGLGAAVATQQIGCSHFEQPPGKTAFPRHWHSANEEALYILEGEGTVHIGDARVTVRAGDFVSFPVGPAHAHLIVNTGTATLKYLALSTLKTPEVVGYPDSKKVGASAAPSIEAARAGQPWLRKLFREGDAVDYFVGESTDARD